MSDTYPITEWSREKREARQDQGPTESRRDGPMFCMKCLSTVPIEYSSHFGRFYAFDKGTDNLHVCLPKVRR